MTSPTSSDQEIMALFNQMTEADRQRVLRFATGILQDRVGKKAQRRSRFRQPPIDDSWRVGH